MAYVWGSDSSLVLLVYLPKGQAWFNRKFCSCGEFLVRRDFTKCGEFIQSGE